MVLEITKDINKQDILPLLGGSYPDYHPESYFDSRIRDKMIFIAKIEQDVVGFLIYTIIWGNTPMIELIKVKPEYQRQGIGKKLLRAALKEISERVPYKVVLSSSEVVNKNGNLFHEKMGFLPSSVVTMFHGEERFYTYNLEEIESYA